MATSRCLVQAIKSNGSPLLKDDNQGINILGGCFTSLRFNFQLELFEGCNTVRCCGKEKRSFPNCVSKWCLCFSLEKLQALRTVNSTVTEGQEYRSTEGQEGASTTRTGLYAGFFLVLRSINYAFPFLCSFFLSFSLRRSWRCCLWFMCCDDTGRRPGAGAGSELVLVQLQPSSSPLQSPPPAMSSHVVKITRKLHATRKAHGNDGENAIHACAIVCCHPTPNNRIPGIPYLYPYSYAYAYPNHIPISIKSCVILDGGHMRVSARHFKYLHAYHKYILKC